MAILPIRKYPDPVLRKKAEAVPKLTKEIKKLVRDMFDTMRKAGGVGLAAPQIGVSKRVVVVDISDKEEGRSMEPMAFLNPEIISQGGSSIEGEEGCLSFPADARGVVPRASKITVRAISEQGKEATFQATELLSRVIQHEVDHLNGILFIDRMSISQAMKVRSILDRPSDSKRKRSMA